MLFHGNTIWNFNSGFAYFGFAGRNMKQDSLSLACAIIMAIAASISVYVEIYDQVEDTIQVVNDNEELIQPIQNQPEYKIIFIDSGKVYAIDYDKNLIYLNDTNNI